MPDIESEQDGCHETAPEEIYLGHLIKITSSRFRSRADALAQSYDLTGTQMHLLHYIESHGGSVQQKEIVRFMRVSHPTVIGLLSRMEKKGFIRSEQDPQDHRNRIIHLTPMANEVTQNAFEDMKKSNEAARKGFSEEEYNQLVRYLIRVYENLQ